MLDATCHRRDERTGLPIHSLYGETRRPTAEMLTGLDAIVIDLQDVGARFYTYMTTMAYVMEEAAPRKIKVFVLDRPSPRRRTDRGPRSIRTPLVSSATCTSKRHLRATG